MHVAGIGPGLRDFDSCLVGYVPPNPCPPVLVDLDQSNTNFLAEVVSVILELYYYSNSLPGAVVVAAVCLVAARWA